VLAALAAASTLTALAAQQRDPRREPPADPQQPIFRVEANYVRVDAFVTKDGVPVRDLALGDFEVLEDGVAQKIEAFEHVEVRGGRDPRTSREPHSVADARKMAADPRNRVFVLFLDTYHTEVAGSHRMRQALITLLNQVLAPDDLVGVMTPEMSATDLTLGRRTDTIEGMLSKYWYWGRRDRVTDRDPEEHLYEACYPTQEYGDVAREMIARRREKRVMDALTDLAVYLRGVRDERKAVIAISNGWALYRPNRALADIGPPIARTVTVPGLGPTGRASTGREDPSTRVLADCERDRVNLSMLDNHQQFLDLFDLANRGNVSFYPVDSRGLPVFDAQLTDPVISPALDQARLRDRIESLRVLALNTDGVAVVNSNDIEGGLKRIGDDLTSYYLLGYYSTNTAFDGRFRRITVRVRRPGVEVRARRGYRAATEAEIEAGLRATATAAAAPGAVERAMDALGGIRGDLRLRTMAGWMPGPGANEDQVRAWFVTEIDAALVRSPEWTGGGRADVRLTSAAGQGLASGEVDVPPGERTFSFTFDAALPPGEYAVRVRLRPQAGGLPYSDVVRFTVPVPSETLGQPRVLRRSPSTGTAFVPTADLRFRRNERLRLEWPAAVMLDHVAGELLDRTGKPMAVPVTVTGRDDPEGRYWVVAQVDLAPLAAGDYAVRLRGEAERDSHEGVVAFRIVP
jgi:VWFA-related protein